MHVCMYICVCMHVCVCVYVLSMGVCMHVCTCVGLCVYVRMCACMSKQIALKEKLRTCPAPEKGIQRTDQISYKCLAPVLTYNDN